MNKKEWREVPGYPGYYVTSDGLIKGPRGKILSQQLSKYGYLHVCTWPKDKTLRMGRAVLLAFYGPPPTTKHVSRHLNRERQDNRIENLKWGTSKENSEDARKHGTQVMGELHGGSKLTASEVRRMRYLYGSMPIAAIGRQFGVVRMTAADAIYRKTWKHVL